MNYKFEQYLMCVCVCVYIYLHTVLDRPIVLCLCPCGFTPGAGCSGFLPQPKDMQVRWIEHYDSVSLVHSTDQSNEIYDQKNIPEFPWRTACK